MAVVRMPLMSIEAKGSVGSVTYDRYGGLAIARSKPQPKADFGEPWQVVKVNMSTVNDAWVALSLSQKADWNAIARNIRMNRAGGGKKTLTGRNWFFKVNMRRSRFGLTFLDAPLLGRPTNFPTALFSIEPTGPSDIVVNVNLHQPFAEGDILEFWVTRPLMNDGSFYDRARLYAHSIFTNSLDSYTLNVPKMFSPYGVAVYITNDSMRQSLPVYGVAFNAPA